MLTELQIRGLRAEELKRSPADRKRYWVAHLAGGRQLHEHNCSWATVPIEQVTMLELMMCGNKYTLERSQLPPNFLGFICFKTAVRSLRGIPNRPDKVESRCIGWTDGKVEYILRIDENTCKPQGQVEVHTVPTGQFPMHLHPLLVKKLKEEQA